MQAGDVAATAPSSCGQTEQGVQRDGSGPAVQGVVEHHDLADVVGFDDRAVTGAQALVGGFDVAERVGAQRAAVDRVQALDSDGTARGRANRVAAWSERLAAHARRRGIGAMPVRHRRWQFVHAKRRRC
jgi:hypothetical protein